MIVWATPFEPCLQYIECLLPCGLCWSLTACSDLLHEEASLKVNIDTSVAPTNNRPIYTMVVMVSSYPKKKKKKRKNYGCDTFNILESFLFCVLSNDLVFPVIEL